MSYTPGSNSWATHHFGPHCQMRLKKVNFGGRKISFNGKNIRHARRLKLIFKQKSPGYLKLIASTPDSGAYNCRPIAGTSTWSMHAWALAFDFRWLKNGRDGDRKSEIRDKAMPAVRQAEKEDWRWGGRWDNPDDMHFESRITPKQARKRYFVTGHRKPWYRKKVESS